MTIGQRISELRKERGYSQEYVAEKLDVSRQAVSKWECDASAPDTYNLIALSELFGVSVEYIAVGKKEPTSDTETQEPESRPVTVTNHFKQSLGLSNIWGIIFLICGLICGVLGIILDKKGLVPVSIACFLNTILLFIQVKHKSVISLWSYWLFLFLVDVFSMTSSPFLIFNPDYYKGGFTWSFIYGYDVWIFLAANIAYTVYYVRKMKKQNENARQESN